MNNGIQVNFQNCLMNFLFQQLNDPFKPKTLAPFTNIVSSLNWEERNCFIKFSVEAYSSTFIESE